MMYIVSLAVSFLSWTYFATSTECAGTTAYFTTSLTSIFKCSLMFVFKPTILALICIYSIVNSMPDARKYFRLFRIIILFALNITIAFIPAISRRRKTRINGHLTWCRRHIYFLSILSIPSFVLLWKVHSYFHLIQQ